MQAPDDGGRSSGSAGVFETTAYEFGRNPLDYSYVTGYGDRCSRIVHHRFCTNRLDGWNVVLA